MTRIVWKFLRNLSINCPKGTKRPIRWIVVLESYQNCQKVLCLYKLIDVGSGGGGGGRSVTQGVEGYPVQSIVYY
jgi:hypothetical protein